MRRQERPETSEPFVGSFLLHAPSLRRATSAADAGYTLTPAASIRNPERCCSWLREVTATTAAPEAGVAEGGGQGEVVGGVGEELSDQEEVSRRAREAERDGAGHKGGQDAHGVVELILESLEGAPYGL